MNRGNEEDTVNRGREEDTVFREGGKIISCIEREGRRQGEQRE